jgi:hypothetical protein
MMGGGRDLDVMECAMLIWEYHHMHDELRKADCILVLGSHDTCVAEYGDRLFLEQWAPVLIMSGRLYISPKESGNNPRQRRSGTSPSPGACPGN